MKKKHSFRDRWLWGLLVAIVLTFVHSTPAHADDAKMNDNNVIMTDEKPYALFNLYLGEVSGDYSYWSGGNFTIYWDNKQICTAADLNLNQGIKTLNGKKSNDSWFGSYHNKSEGVFVGVYNIYGSNNEVWVMLVVIPDYQYIGSEHTLKLNGTWANNDSKSWKEFIKTVTTNYSKTDIGTLGRSTSGKIKFTDAAGAASLSNGSSYDTYMDLLTETPSNVPISVDGAYSKYVSGKTDVSGLEYSVADNDKAYKFYPRSRRCLTSGYIFRDGLPNTKIQFIEDHAAVKIPCYPVPSNLTFEKYQWDSKTKIRWDYSFADTGNRSLDGEFVVYYKDNAQNESGVVTSLACKSSGSSSYVYHTDVTFNTKYTYTVAFVPSGWSSSASSQPANLNVSKDYTLEPTFYFNEFTATSAEDRITLNWKFDPMEDAATANPKHTVTLQRRVGQTGEWEDIYTQTIGSKSTISGTYTDKDYADCYTIYNYQLVTNVLGDVRTSNIVTASVTGASKVTNLEATRGTYNGRVRLTWTADQYGTSPTSYTVSRRKLGSDDDDDWMEIYNTTGTAVSYSYEDQTALAGDYYEYRVESKAWIAPTSDTDAGSYADPVYCYADGFALARGVVSGRVYYDTGTAVVGARVKLETSNDNGDDNDQFYSLSMKQDNQGITWAVPGALQGTEKAWTIQMFYRPDETITTDSSIPAQLITSDENPLLSVSQDVTDSVSYVIVDGNNGKHHAIDEFAQITLVSDGTNIKGFMVDKTGEVTELGQGLLDFASCLGETLSIGTQESPKQAYGYIDEIRIWNRALSESEIQKDADHTLAGTETGLVGYMPLDEGISGQTKAYDYSKSGGMANNHHGTIVAGAPVSTIVPNSEQLNLAATTDANGNYVIRGVPYTGEGTNYSVIPTMGVHEFSPSSQSRFVSSSSQVHSGVDFTDVSSFSVKGVVYYENTTYPVEGVMFAVDGVTCTRNGNLITTNSIGEYEISVPIGKHYITASLTGHTFVNDGRYPENPDENSCETVVFDQEVTGLTFYDNTLVNIAGRVVGGKDEADKEIGFGLSYANIGQAMIKLEPVRATVSLNVVKDTSTGAVNYIDNTDSLKYGVRGDINSKATVGIAGGTDGTRTVTILTDPETGEFSALVPPIQYKVKSVTIPSQTELSLLNESEIIDASGDEEKTDSIENGEGGYEKYSYTAKFINEYDSNPLFFVTSDNDTTAAYGEKSVTVDDVEVPLYSVKYSDTSKPGKINYAYNYPIFQMCTRYTYYLEGYEQYINKDADPDPKKSESEKWIYSKRPLSGYIVNVQNEMGSTTSVYDASQSNAGAVADCPADSIVLDSLGTARFTWMAGLPNITAPYTRTLTISYGENGNEYVWGGNDGDGVGTKGIVLGELPTGNNFVTEGPNQISMILRDPPGSASQAWFEKGAEVSTTHSLSETSTTDAHLTTVTHFGSEIDVGTGIGTMRIDEIKSVHDMTIGASTENSYEGGHSYTETTSSTDRISTSAEDTYVGHGGDIYMGSSTNLIYGNNRYLAIEKNSSGNYAFNVGNNISVSTSIATRFVYDENYIVNTLIPNLEMLRNSLLVTEIDPSSTNIQYWSKVSTEDENFGSDNTDKDVWGSDASSTYDDGPSYTVVVPSGYKTTYSNQVLAYNNWIKNWKNIIAENERQKVLVQNNRDKYLIENVSFSPGSSIEHESTTEYDTTYVSHEEFSASVTYNSDFGVEFNGTGVTFSLGADQSGGFIKEGEYSHSNSKSFGYALVETGTSDALSVDVYNAPDGFGPIFITRAGQTSCPFEDEVQSMYYRNNAGNPVTISAKTMQVEKPEIAAEAQAVTGVPSGKEANFTVYLRNNSEVSENCYYNLSIDPESNVKGAAVELSGQNLMNGVSIFCEAGKELTQTVTVKQTDLSVMDYDSLKLVLSSTCDDNVSSEILLHATFVPAGADIDLAVSPTTLNSNTDTCVTVIAKNFDRNYSTLKNVKLQYRRVNETDWTNLLTCAKSDLKDQMNSLGQLVKVFNMKEVMDGEFEFRAITECTFGNQTINGESDVVNVVKDVALPQLISVPSPSDGIFNYGDEISLTFNEDIEKDALTKADNFLVAGVLNGAEVTHDVALQMNGTDAAQTEARIDLSNRNFSIETWLYWSEAGVLMQHGSADNNMQISVDASGHLVITYGGKTYKSSNTITMNQWVYLMLRFAVDEEDSSVLRISADYAEDASETSLFSSKKAIAYTGNGILTLGGSLKGMMHELTLWNTARTKAEGLSQMYETKSNYTQGLIGYWQLNEGNGTLAEDRSRSRNLTVADNSWYIYGTNYVMELKGTLIPAVAIGNISTTSDESYMIEGWFRANSTQSSAHLLRTSNSNIDLYLNSAGGLVLKSISGSGVSTSTTVSSTDLRDSLWHHIALNVLKSTNGNATVYIDGSAVKNISASLMPSLQADKLYIGRYFNGGIDEVRIWKGRRTADVIKSKMYSRVSADEPGLLAYFPMDTTYVDAYNQKQQKATFYDATNHCTYIKASGLSSSSEDTPPIKAVQSTQNVPFEFVASERKILINLDEDPATIEGCTIYFTANKVKDANGNGSDPVTWSAYIQQNQLKWGESEVSVRKLDDNSVTFDVDIKNNGGTSQDWVISNLPSWLSVNSESGTLDALGSKTITFTVSPSVPMGRYESTVYLTGSMDINEPLVINLTSAATPPDWAVDASGYANTMNIIGQLKIDGKLSENSEDMVAAFRGNECVGVASPTYFKKYDSYYLMMNVYGNDEDYNTDLSFKVFDASTGTTYPLVTLENPTSISFGTDMIGTFAKPVIFSPDEAIEQNLDLRSGYTWVSIYVTPKDATLNSIFKNNAGELNRIANKSTFSLYSSGAWHGELSTMAVGGMYKINASKATTTSVVGTPVVPTAIEMTINSGWNWIGYNCGSYNSLENAFADLSPTEGDIVKSQSAFSVYSSGEWIGTLDLMTPGLGYCYWTENTSARTFHYPTVSASSNKMPRKVQANDQFSNTQYESNMSIMAVVMDGDQVVSNAEVSVYADGELRAASAQAVRDDIHFLTVGGNKQTGALRFVVTVNGFDYLLDATEMFEADGVRGSLASPLVLQMGEATGIKSIIDDNDSENLFDLSGRRINRLMQKNVYIQNGVKRLSK